MKKYFVLLGLFFCTHSNFAQKNTAQKYAQTITGIDLQKYLSVIAGNDFEGRETGTEGQRKAAAYIEQQFKTIGLQAPLALGGYQQYYPVFVDSVSETPQLKINNATKLYGKDFISPLGNNETGNFKSKKIVFVGYGIADEKYNDYANLNVKGKVVILFLGEPKKEGKYLITGTSKSSSWTYPGISKKLAVAEAKGAVGALIINPNQENFTPQIVESTKKSALYYLVPSKTINYALISHDLAKNILNKNFDFALYLKLAKANETLPTTPFEKNIKTTYTFIKYRRALNASNVIGIIEGTDKKDEYVFLTAHYDHLGKHGGKIYYGADDDGSGTCAVIKMAEAFAIAAKEGNRPRRTLVFMTVSGEEKGLWGSEYYSDHPIFLLDKTSADLNTDMVGRIDTERQTADTTHYVYVIGHDKLSSDLPIINEGANNENTQLVLDYKFDDPNDLNGIYFRSDHYNFARKGVPILFFYDGMLQADYHKPTDTVDKINWDLYEKRVRMIFYTAWQIANRDDMLKRDIPLNMGTR